VLLTSPTGSSKNAVLDPPQVNSSMLYLTLLLMGIAAVFSYLDVSRVWCDPDHPFLQGQ